DPLDLPGAPGGDRSADDEVRPLPNGPGPPYQMAPPSLVLTSHPPRFGSRHTSRMLELTPEAIRAVADYVVGHDAGATAGLRISPGPHSRVDRTWAYSVEHEPSECDLLIEHGSACVSVCPQRANQRQQGQRAV